MAGLWVAQEEAALLCLPEQLGHCRGQLSPGKFANGMTHFFACRRKWFIHPCARLAIVQLVWF